MAKQTVTAKLTGHEKLIKQLERYSANMEKRYEKGLKKAGVWLLRESKKIVPVDTRALRDSGIVTQVGKGLKTTILVSYSTTYAIYVHEDLNARHAKGKSAKYLEIPFRAGIATMRDIIKAECQKAKF